MYIRILVIFKLTCFFRCCYYCCCNAILFSKLFACNPPSRLVSICNYFAHFFCGIVGCFPYSRVQVSLMGIWKKKKTKIKLRCTTSNQASLFRMLSVWHQQRGDNAATHFKAQFFPLLACCTSSPPVLFCSTRFYIFSVAVMLLITTSLFILCDGKRVEFVFMLDVNFCLLVEIPNQLCYVHKICFCTLFLGNIFLQQLSFFSIKFDQSSAHTHIYAR